MKRLTRLANKYKTDKGTEFSFAHGFTEFYEPYFNQYDCPTILELGVDAGAAEKMLNNFYDGYCNIYCVDIEDKSGCFEGFGNIKFFKCDLSKKENVERLIESFNGVKFDIIIDDASHIWADQFLCLNMLRHCLNPGGIYILEDLHTSYEGDIFGYHQEFSQSPLYFLVNNSGQNSFLLEDAMELSLALDTCIIFKRRNFRCNELNCNSVTALITFIE